MSVEPTHPPRYKVQEQASALRLIFPLPANWLIAAPLGIALVPWLAGEVVAIGLLLIGGYRALEGLSAWGAGPLDSLLAVFLGAWVLGWSYGGAKAIRSFRLNSGGKEIVDVDDTWLRIRRLRVGMGRTERFSAAYVDNLRVVAPYVPRDRSEGVRGPLAFDYAGKTVFFGGGLTEEEAKEALAVLAKRYPELTQGIGGPPPEQAS